MHRLTCYWSTSIYISCATLRCTKYRGCSYWHTTQCFTIAHLLNRAQTTSDTSGLIRIEEESNEYIDIHAGVYLRRICERITLKIYYFNFIASVLRCRKHPMTFTFRTKLLTRLCVAITVMNWHFWLCWNTCTEFGTCGLNGSFDSIHKCLVLSYISFR